MRYLCTFLAFLLLTACNDTKTPVNEETENQAPQPSTETTAPDRSFQTLSPLSPAELKPYPFEGEVVTQKRWRDAQGEQTALLTRNEKELFVYHYRRDEAGVRLVQSTTDHVKDCTDDITLAFLDDAIAVTDVDNDRVGELTFAYETACRTDVSPVNLHVVLWVDGKSYYVQGYNTLELGDQRLAEGRRVEDNLSEASPAWRAQLDRTWQAIVE